MSGDSLSDNFNQFGVTSDLPPPDQYLGMQADKRQSNDFNSEKQTGTSFSDESFLDRTRGHFTTDGEESDKESGAEWNEGDMSSDCTSGCYTTPPKSLPSCPYCQMVPLDHPRFSEIHNVAMLLVSRLLREDNFCMLVAHDETNATNQQLQIKFLPLVPASDDSDDEDLQGSEV